MDNQSKKHILWHIADIHIRNGVHADILYSLEQFISKIKSEVSTAMTNQIVVIAGDVFEKKNEFNQYDLDCFHTIIDKLIFIKVLIIPGNHDYSPNPEKNLDFITVALQNTKFKHVYMFRDSGIYNIPDFDDVEFHILSPIDNIIPTIVNNSYGIKVAILHEPIKTCTDDNPGFMSNKSRLDITDFDDYNIVLAGDIHKHQFLGANKHIAYSGSFIQKKKSEGPEHGCIKWTIGADQPFSAEFIPFRLSNCNVTIIVDGKKTITRPLQRLIESIKYVELIESNCSAKLLNYYQSKVRAKFGRLDITKHTEKSKITTTTENLLTTSNQITLLNEELQDYPYKQEVLELHNKSINLLTNEITYTNHKWRLNYLYWDNMFCYGEGNFINFNNLTGVNSLIGNNYTGKSSIIDILIYILYDHLFRGDGKSVVNVGCKKYKIVCNFSVILDNTQIVDTYEISRIGDNNAGGQISTCMLLKLAYNNPKWNNITSATIPETYKILQSIIGTYKGIISINIALQTNIFIVDKTIDDQIAEFNKYCELDKLTAIDLNITKCLAGYRKELKELKAENQNPEIAKLEKKKVKTAEDDAKLLKLKHLEKLLETYKLIPDDLDAIILELTDKQTKLDTDITNKRKSINNLNKKLHPKRYIIDDILHQLEKLINVSIVPVAEYDTEILVNNAKLEELYKEYDIVKNAEYEAEILANNLELEPYGIVSNITNIDQHLKKLENVKVVPFAEYDAEILVNNAKLEQLFKQYVTVKHRDLTALDRQLTKINSELPKEYPVDISLQITNKNAKIKELRAKITHTKYSLDQLNDILNNNDVDNVDLVKLNEKLTNNITLITKLQNDQTSIVITNKFNVQKTAYKQDEINMKIKEFNLISVEELYSKVLPISPDFNPAVIVADPNINYDDLVKNKKLIEQKITILNEVKKAATYLKFNDECSCCQSNKSLLTDDKEKIQQELLLINESITKYKAYELHKQKLSNYQHNLQVQNKINILHDSAHFNEIELKQRSQQITININTLNKENTVIIYKIDVLKIADSIKSNDKYSTTLKQLETQVESFTKILEKVQLKENLEYIKLTQLNNDKLDISIAKIKEETNSLMLVINNIKLKKVLLDRKKIYDNHKLIQLNNDKLDILIAKLKEDTKSITLIINNIQLKKTLLDRKKIYDTNLLIDEKIALIDVELDKQTKEYKDNVTKLEEYTKVSETLIKYSEISTKIISLEKQIDIYKKYSVCIDPTNGIPYKLLKTSCVDIELGINSILNDITDFTISLGFELKKFKIMIVDKDKRIPAEQASGFQKFIIDFSLRLCLVRNHPSLPNFLIIDEGFGCADDDHKILTSEFLDKLNSQNKFEWVLVISHIKELHSASRNFLEIKQVDKKSKIINDVIPLFPNAEITTIYSQEDTIIEDPDDPNRLYCTSCEKSYKYTSTFTENHPLTKTHLAKLIKNKQVSLTKKIGEIHKEFE